MSKAPPGALVRIHYDGRDLLVGDVLESRSRRTGEATGRYYLVVARREQLRGKHSGRQHLGCLVQRQPPPDARVLPIYWYARARRRAPGAGTAAAPTSEPEHRRSPPCE